MEYPHRLAVSRKTSISDGIGGFTETYNTVGSLSDVSCHMRQLNAKEIIINDKMSVQATHRAYCDDISITTSDLVWITLYGETTSDLFDVQTINRKTELGSGALHHLELDIEVIK